MPSPQATVLALASIVGIPAVLAHGFVQSVIAGGRTYPGPDPSWIYGDKPARAGWYAHNQDTGYVGPRDFGSWDLACHKQATSGSQSIEVNAGETVTLQWTEWPESHHGPVITSLSRCHSDCSTATPEQLHFFTIDSQGLISGSPSPGKWASDTLIANGNKWTVTIPPSLSGNFVLRHDIIALHSAQDQNGDNGAQSYPQCINLRVAGQGQQHPCKEGADCRQGPELYGVNDPGILVNIYYPALTNYTIPGPPVFPGLGQGRTVSTGV